MNHHRIGALALSAAFVMTATLTVSTARAEAPLGVQMHAMGRDFKTLNNQINDPSQNKSSLAAIADMEQHTLNAKLLTPPMITIVPENRRAAFMTAFRTKIAQLIQQELQLEQQLLANQNADAAKTLKEMKQTQTEGHAEFRHKK